VNKKKLTVACAIGLSAVAGRAGAQTTNLFDGSLGTSPDSQLWLGFQSVPPGAMTTTTSTNTTLDTTSSLTIDAGYSDYVPFLTPSFTVGLELKNTSFPVLNASTGFTLSFTAKVNSESHTGTNGANRAGFDVIALDKSDNGIELGFWGNDNDVWAQGTTPTLFTRAEDATLNSESGSHNYSLQILGSTYALFVDGSSTPVLTGPTRNYSSSPVAVYSEPDMVFLGDDTGDAEGSETFSAISITVPEPTSVAVLLASAGLLAVRRRKVIN
jgi:hypothetical protein